MIMIILLLILWMWLRIGRQRILKKKTNEPILYLTNDLNVAELHEKAPVLIATKDGV